MAKNLVILTRPTAVGKTGNGLVVNDLEEVLLTDEFQLDMKMTKFPGGGLHFGEGTVDCMKREFREECKGQEIENIRHFYTTDFFQEALLYENHQLISIYYMADLKEPLRFKISKKSFDFEKMENGRQSFRWVNINLLNLSELSFPIDKFVAEKLKNQYFENG